MFAYLFFLMVSGSKPDACDTYAPGAMDVSRTWAVEAIDPSGLPDGNITCFPAPDRIGLQRRLDGALDGVRFYVMLKDGLAAIESAAGPAAAGGYWMIRCRYDATMDTKMCAARQGDLIVALVDEQLQVKVGTNYYIPSDIVLRVDAVTPWHVSSENAGSWNHKAIAAALTAGQVARTRYTHLVDGVQDGVTSLAGLPQAVALMRQIYAQIERLPSG